jgi:hypothetical protein
MSYPDYPYRISPEVSVVKGFHAGYDIVMESEQEYALDLIRARKKLLKEIEEKKSSRSKWESRVLLAKKAGRADLEAAAEKECSALDSVIQELEVEESTLAKETEKAKAEWKTARVSRGLSVDAAALAAELEAMAGPEAARSNDPAAIELDAMQKEAEVQEALEALKREMEAGEKEQRE